MWDWWKCLCELRLLQKNKLLEAIQFDIPSRAAVFFLSLVSALEQLYQVLVSILTKYDAHYESSIRTVHGSVLLLL